MLHESPTTRLIYEFYMTKQDGHKANKFCQDFRRKWNSERTPENKRPELIMPDGKWKKCRSLLLEAIARHHPDAGEKADARKELQRLSETHEEFFLGKLQNKPGFACEHAKQALGRIES